MSKTQGSGVDCRCDGEEISLRDQREGTGLSDRVKEDVSQEYFTCRNEFIYLWGPQRTSEALREAFELGGLEEYFKAFKGGLKTQLDC